MRAKTALLVTLLLSGCANQNFTWRHPNYEKGQFDRDVAQCQYEAAQATASYSSGPTSRTTSGAIAQGIGDGIELGTRRRELGMLCMKAKGYIYTPL